MTDAVYPAWQAIRQAVVQSAPAEVIKISAGSDLIGRAMELAHIAKVQVAQHAAVVTSLALAMLMLPVAVRLLRKILAMALSQKNVVYLAVESFDTRLKHPMSRMAFTLLSIGTMALCPPLSVGFMVATGNLCYQGGDVLVDAFHHRREVVRARHQRADSEAMAKARQREQAETAEKARQQEEAEALEKARQQAEAEEVQKVRPQEAEAVEKARSRALPPVSPQGDPAALKRPGSVNLQELFAHPAPRFRSRSDQELRVASIQKAQERRLSQGIIGVKSLVAEANLQQDQIGDVHVQVAEQPATEAQHTRPITPIPEIVIAPAS